MSSTFPITTTVPINKQLYGNMDRRLSSCLNAITWVWLSNWLTAALNLIRRSTSWRLKRSMFADSHRCMEPKKIVHGKWKKGSATIADGHRSLYDFTETKLNSCIWLNSCYKIYITSHPAKNIIFKIKFQTKSNYLFSFFAFRML